MKTVLLLRHAKSSWSNPGLADINRPLNKRGKRDAPRMGALLDEEDLIPDLIITSSAVRAKQTAEYLAECLGYQGKIKTSDALYMGEPQDYAAALKEVKEKIESVLIVGHNPGLEAYLQIIDGEIESMPTGSLGYLMLAVEDWESVSLETMGDLIGFWKPKDLRDKE